MAVRGTLTIEGARIMFPNFAGKESDYNEAGRRNFCVALNPDLAQRMIQDGWNVKTLMPREDDEENEIQYYIKVQVSYRYADTAPKICRINGSHHQLLNEANVSCLDWDDIENCDLVISPYNWQKGARSGVTAYLKSMYVTVRRDILEEKYAQFIDPNEDLQMPFDMNDVPIE